MKVKHVTAAGFVALATAFAGLGTVSASASDALDWGTCDDEGLAEAGARCATLTVPLDRSHPDGKKVKIAVSRIKATAPDSKYQGPLVGGFLQVPLDLDGIPAVVRNTYDLIGFDVRGTGASRPLLNCGSNPYAFPQPAYRPETGPGDAPGANERAWLARYDRFVDACDDRYGDELGRYTTDDKVADLDALRRALGADRLNLLGGGSDVAQTYATRFPGHVRRLVLDGAFDPRKTGYARVTADNAATELGMHRFFSWVAEHDDVYFLGADAETVERTYYREEAALTEHPKPKFGPAEWSDTFRNVSFYEPAWPELAGVWSKWFRGKTKPMLEFAADDSTTEELNQYVAGDLVHDCAEGAWPTDYDRWRRDTFEAAETAPFIAWSMMLNGLGCRTWPVRHAAPAVGSSDAGPMLLIAAGDDQAFMNGTLELRRRFDKAVLVTVPGSVTAPTNTGNVCIDDIVVDYLRDGTLPDRKAGDGPDGTCEPTKKPKPDPRDVKAAEKLRAGGYARGGDGGNGGAGGGDGGDGGSGRS